MDSFKILENSVERLVVLIDPVAYEGRLVFRDNPGPKPGALISFNTNYFWKDNVIGTFRQGPFEYVYRNPVPGERPKIGICGCTCQAGPLLVDEGDVIFEKSIRQGAYHPSTIRETTHVCGGYNEVNKYIISYFENATIKEMAWKMKALGCRYAIKFDGGHSSYLQVGDIVRKVDPRLTCGVQLFRRK